MPQKHLVLFDGVCVLCNGSVRFLLRHDRRWVFSFAQLSGGTAAALYTRHPELRSEGESVVFAENFGGEGERISVRSDAAIAILSHLGGFWKLFAVLLRILPRAGRDRAYDFIAARRYRWFGKLDACVLPSQEDRARFLD